MCIYCQDDRLIVKSFNITMMMNDVYIMCFVFHMCCQIHQVAIIWLLVMPENYRYLLVTENG